MTTIINTPPQNENSTLAVVVIVLLVLGVVTLAVIYVLPIYRQAQNTNTADIKVSVPLPSNTPNNGN